MKISIYLRRAPTNELEEFTIPRPITYIFGKGFDVEFKLDTLYESVADSTEGMFFVVYDGNTAPSNNSVSRISRVRYDGTDCFSKLLLVYRYGEVLEVHATPKECAIPLE